MKRRVILDVDTGVDDALALAYAVHSPELELLGVTTCFGNVTAEEATRNTLAVLESLGEGGSGRIPVVEGAKETLRRGEKPKYSRHVHGEDGLGNALKTPPQGSAQPGNAADFIIAEVRRRPHEVTIISVGPLTNLAQAIERDPGIVPLVREVIVMGGAVGVPGNVTPYGEANIVADPEAAAAVFAAGLPLTLVGLDVTLQTLLPRTQLDVWRASGRRDALFLAEMCEHYMGFYESCYPGLGGCGLHDPLAVGVAVDPSLVKAEPMRVTVVTEGEETGRTVGTAEGEPKIRVCTAVDADRFLKHFLSRVV
ncbi:nucleoside hydrolase [Paenibacillus sp. M1]|uniref:Nucleoside hydrolase n=1 Tax=Paenibacillus haidiansis TaxID=1574488 RepID=A0ABU7VU06_9BACL